MRGRSLRAALVAGIRAGEVGGGVILFGASSTSLAGLHTLVAQLQRAAAAGGNPPLLVAVDQRAGRFDV